MQQLVMMSDSDRRLENGLIDWKEALTRKQIRQLTAVGRAFSRAAFEMPSSSNFLAVPTKWEAPAIVPPVYHEEPLSQNEFMKIQD